MSYHVLARKWRPQTFADLVGQSHVVKALTYALSHNQIHHAYLFTGTRGVGKTSIARIFAKSLNCETNGVSAEPCGQCESCSEITAGKFVDLIEVDAASRTGVDETRELIESVAYLPTKGRYKVYLIDEVHMFSKSSFNALLKTLEEPPEHVKFILATTDPEKLPITILSRCLQFNLKSLTQRQIRQHLENICETESIAYDAEALALLAGAGDGSMRDTLSMTDQAIAYGHGALRLSAVTEILGTIQPADIEAILFAIATNNPNQLSTALHRLDDYEVDARAFLIEIMHRLQRMAWAKEGIVEQLSSALQSTVADIPKPLLHLWYDIAQKALPNLATAGEPREAVEMALLRMLAFIPNDWVVRHRTLLDNDITPKNHETHEIAPPAADAESTNKAEKTAPATTTGATDETVPFAATVQAAPVVEHDSLAAAEAEFSGESELSSSEPSEPAAPAPAINAAVSEATNNNSAEETAERSSQAPENIKKIQENQESPVQAVSATSSAPSAPENITQQAWHLSSQTDDAPTPSMADIQALMQRGSDLKRPEPTTEEPAIEQPADQPAVEQANTEQPVAEQSAESVAETPVDAATSATEDTPPWAEAVNSPPTAANTVESPPAKTTEETTAAPVTQPIQTATPLAVDVTNFDWYDTLSGLGLSEYAQHFASLGILRVNLADDNTAAINAVFDLSPKHEVMITDDSIQQLSEALQNHFDAPIQLSVNLTQVDETTPAQRNKHASDAQQADLLAQFKNDPITAQFIHAFGADVLPSTVKARNA